MEISKEASEDDILKASMKSEQERALAQYEYEKEHRERILTSPKGKKRARAFADAYSGLAKGIASKKFCDLETESQEKGIQKFQLVKRFLGSMDVAAEFGPGDFSLARVVAQCVYSLALIDVVDDSAKAKLPKNCTFYQGDGVSVPQGLFGFTVAYSSHVIEHMHPEELHDHLVSVHQSLAEKGKYIIFTPNGLSGPHDISKAFSDVAEGLHLKEYTVGELHSLLRNAGFSKVWCYAGGKGIYIRVPLSLSLSIEAFLDVLPQKSRRFFASFLLVRALLGIIIVGQK